MDKWKFYDCLPFGNTKWKILHMLLNGSFALRNDNFANTKPKVHRVRAIIHLSNMFVLNRNNALYSAY